MRGNVTIEQNGGNHFEHRGLWATWGVQEVALDGPVFDLDDPPRHLGETDDGSSAIRDLAHAVALASEAGEWLRVEAILHCLDALLKDQK